MMIEVMLMIWQVVCATCAGAGDPLLSMCRFRAVVIDEASQVW
jgi:superfamily I DNA and/or RNA helicase